MFYTHDDITYTLARETSLTEKEIRHICVESEFWPDYSLLDVAMSITPMSAIPKDIYYDDYMEGLAANLAKEDYIQLSIGVIHPKKIL